MGLQRSNGFIPQPTRYIIKLNVGEQIIETTDNHPFWVEGKGWVFADELQVGDNLQKADGAT
ncbi:hypothetical protein C7Y44_11880 [Paenibacillus popilliae]|uniref:Uncharacterized protein n=1 Tax=Paenibacillus popilliae TaxID=78057 RepID=A0ABY3ATZ0_PAEPP|nr:hypothetical protein C7Y44_11880 [Paenibacillus sp. SDF0028]